MRALETLQKGPAFPYPGRQARSQIIIALLHCGDQEHKIGPKRYSSLNPRGPVQKALWTGLT